MNECTKCGGRIRGAITGERGRLYHVGCLLMLMWRRKEAARKGWRTRRRRLVATRGGKAGRKRQVGGRA